MKIAVVNSSSFGKYFPEHIKQLEEIGKVDFYQFDALEPTENLITALNDYDYIISSVTPNFTREFFEACPKLKLISRHGIGYNNIDIAAASDHKVYVTRVFAEVEKDAVAENAIALLMALARQVVPAAITAKEGNWLDRAKFMGVQLQGKTAGIIGFGNIGSRVATILKDGFNMKILAYDPVMDTQVINKINDVTFVDLDTLLKEADFVSLNASLNEENYHLLKSEQLRQMKSQALIVNTARGALIDEKAIIDAVRNGVIGGYASDVVEGEPVFEDHPLFKETNILITPHTSAYTWECLAGMGEKCVSDVQAVANGKVPLGMVSKF